MWFLPSFLLLLLVLRLSTCDDSSTVLDELPNPPLSTTSETSVATDKGASNKETSGPCNRNRTLGKKHDPWVMYERVRNMPVAQVQKQSKTFFERVIDRVELVLQCRREEKQRLETELVQLKLDEEKSQKDFDDAVKGATTEKMEKPKQLDKEKLKAEITQMTARLAKMAEDQRNIETRIRQFLPDETDKREHISQLLKNETLFADAINSLSLKLGGMESERMNLSAILDEKRELIARGEKWLSLNCVQHRKVCDDVSSATKTSRSEAQHVTSALGKIGEAIAKAESDRNSLKAAWEPLRDNRDNFVTFLEAMDNHTAAVAALKEAEESAQLTPEVAESKAQAALAFDLKFLTSVLSAAKKNVVTIQQPLTAVTEEIPAMEAKLEAMRKGLEKFRNYTIPDDIEDTYIAPVVSAICFLISLSAIPFAYRAIRKNLNEGKNSKPVMKNVKKIPYAVKISKKTEKEVASGSSLSSNAEAQLSSMNDEHRDSHFSSSDSHFVNTTFQRRFTEDP